jgi:hypothetical protein
MEACGLSPRSLITGFNELPILIGERLVLCVICGELPYCVSHSPSHEGHRY